MKFIDKFLFLITFIVVTSCASKKKIGLHFQNIAYTQYSRHEDLNMDAEPDTYTDSLRKIIAREYAISTDSIDPQNKSINNPKPQLESSKKLEFDYDKQALTEEVRLFGDVSSPEYQERKKKKHARLKKSRNRKARSKAEPFSLVSFLTGFATIVIALTAGSISSIPLATGLAIFGLITGGIGLVRIERKSRWFGSHFLAKIGVFIAGTLLILGMIALIVGPPFALAFFGL